MSANLTGLTVAKLAATDIAEKTTKALEDCSSIYCPAVYDEPTSCIFWVFTPLSLSLSCLAPLSLNLSCLTPLSLNLSCLFLSSSAQIWWFHIMYFVSDMMSADASNWSLGCYIVSSMPRHYTSRKEFGAIFYICIMLSLRDFHCVGSDYVLYTCFLLISQHGKAEWNLWYIKLCR